MQRYWPERCRESLEDWVFLPLATASCSDKLDKTDHKREQKHFYPLMHQCLIISLIQCLLGDFFRIHFAAIPFLKDIHHPTSHKRLFPPDEGFSFVLLRLLLRYRGHRISLGINEVFQIQILCHLKLEIVTWPVKTFSWTAKLTYECSSSMWTIAKTFQRGFKNDSYHSLQEESSQCLHVGLFQGFSRLSNQLIFCAFWLKCFHQKVRNCGALRKKFSKDSYCADLIEPVK